MYRGEWEQEAAKEEDLTNVALKNAGMSPDLLGKSSDHISTKDIGENT